LLVTWNQLEKYLPWGLSSFIFLLFVGVSLFLPSQLGPTPNDWFSDYAHALLQGKLYLSEGANGWRDCQWDQSFYKGKCYLYFGIIPAFLHLLLPFFTNRFISILSGAVFTFFLTKMVILIASLRTKDEKGDLFVSSFLILGSVLAMSVLSLALSSRIYEETILVAHMFGIAGSYLGLSYFPGFEFKRSPRRLWGASILLSLAALTRISWFAPLGIFSLFLFWDGKRMGGWKQALSKSWVPMVWCLGALVFQGVLNWSRFENPLDFGVEYVSTQIRWAERRQSAYGLNSWHFILPNFISYFLVPLFLGKQIVVRDPQGFLQKVLLHKILLYENPHTLLFALPGAFAAIFHLKKFGRFVIQNWALVAFFIPLWAPTLTMDCVIHRYQFEVFASFLLLAVPFLVSDSAVMSNRSLVFQALGFVGGTIFTVYQTIQILERHWSVL